MCSYIRAIKKKKKNLPTHVVIIRIIVIIFVIIEIVICVPIVVIVIRVVSEVTGNKNKALFRTRNEGGFALLFHKKVTILGVNS